MHVPLHNFPVGHWRSLKGLLKAGAAGLLMGLSEERCAEVYASALGLRVAPSWMMSMGPVP